MDELSVLRKKMNQLSLEITDLLLERRRLALCILQVKKKMTLNVWDPQREQELLELVSKGLPSDEKNYVVEIFKEILAQMRAP